MTAAELSRWQDRWSPEETRRMAAEYRLQESIAVVSTKRLPPRYALAARVLAAL